MVRIARSSVLVGSSTLLSGLFEDVSEDYVDVPLPSGDGETALALLVRLREGETVLEEATFQQRLDLVRVTDYLGMANSVIVESVVDDVVSASDEQMRAHLGLPPATPEPPRAARSRLGAYFEIFDALLDYFRRFVN